jgi:arylsulfatase A-like enzyme
MTTRHLCRSQSASAITRRSSIKQSVGAAAAALLMLLTAAISSAADLPDKPNVLFIAVDDLNHWVTHLGRNPQAKTPNIDRLASQGVTFTNAHTAVPACEPSRCALMSGRRPWVSGCYKNGDNWMSHQAAGEGLSAQFLRAGYHVAGAGKIYHYLGGGYPSEWSEYMSKEGHSLNGPGVNKDDGYHNDVVHPDLKDQDIIDWHTVDYCIERISQKRDKPFFVACGLFKPHLAFVAPRKYYEAFPLDEIALPPHREDDLDDIPPAGVRMAQPNGDHARFLKSGRWKAAIQSYLATCAYTDMNVGRLLDALENSPNKDNTIICLWSDHGWSLGEKQHWRKFALWEEPTRVVYIWVVPGLTPKGARCHRPVDLMSVYPTLCKLAGVPVPDHVSGPSIVPLLKDPNAPWDLPAITTHGRGNHSVKTETHRYIRYQNGDEELYHVTEDPYEWENLASRPESRAIKQELAKYLPVQEAPEPPVE